MEHECEPAEDDEAAVRLGGLRGWVRMWNRVHPYDDDLKHFCVEIGAWDMTARVHGVAVYNEAPERFVGELAENFEGWSGTRVWESLNRDVKIEAVYRSGGHVDMTWSLSPWRGRDEWSASVTVQRVEAGEQMRGLAEDMRQLLG